MVHGTKKESSFTPRDILRLLADIDTGPEKGYPPTFIRNGEDDAEGIVIQKQ